MFRSVDIVSTKLSYKIQNIETVKRPMLVVL